MDVEDLDRARFVPSYQHAAIPSDFSAMRDVREAVDGFDEFAVADGEELDCAAGRNGEMVGGCSECAGGGLRAGDIGDGVR